MVEMRKSGSRDHFLLDAQRRAVSLGLRSGLVQIVREQYLAFATLVKCDANAKGEQAANDPHKYFHAFNLGMTPRIFKLEASPC